MGEMAFEILFPLHHKLKVAGLTVDMPYEKDKGLKWLMKQADRVGAAYAVMVGEYELTSGQAIVKQLANGTQENVAIKDLETYLHSKAGATSGAN